MAWPGTSLPPGAKPRCRRAKARRGGGSSALVLRIARKLGVAAMATPTTNAVGRCLDCVYQELSFSSPSALSLYLDALSRQRGGTGRVRLPPEKVPAGARAVVGIKCPTCKGNACDDCAYHGWGIIVRVAIKKCACGHGASRSAAGGSRGR